MTTAEATIKLRELIGEARVAMATTSTPAGELHSRPLTIGSIDDDGTFRFLVDATASWVTGLRHADPINLAITNDDDKVWLSVAGTIRVAEDPATVHRLWSPEGERFFPGGVDDPNLRVLVVDPTTAEYWDAPASRIERLAMKASSLLGRHADPGRSGSIDLH
jgi:general stress protein 26